MSSRKDLPKDFSQSTALPQSFSPRDITEKYMQYAIQFFQSGKLEKALELCEHVLSLNPNHAEAFHILGVIAFEKGNYSQAISLIRQAIQQNKDVATYYYNLANALEKDGQYDDAVYNYQQALARNPRDINSLINLGCVLLLQDKHIASQECFQKALSLDPLRPDILANLAQNLRKQGDLQQAVAVFLQALEMQPGMIEAFMGLGGLYNDLDQQDEMQKCFQKVLALHPDRRDIRVLVETEMLSGEHYHLILKRFHELLQPTAYVEIGVARGETLAFALPETKAVGIDPDPKISHQLSDKTEVFPFTSDAFFDKYDLQKIANGFELAFIDGLHLFEQVLKDFINIERCASKDTIVLLHDTIPPDELSGSREYIKPCWAGDCWKIVPCLKAYRPDLQIFTLTSKPTGLTMVTNLAPSSTILAEKYNEIVSEFVDLPYRELEKDRDNVLNLIPARWPAILEVLKDHNCVRNISASPDAAVEEYHAEQTKNIFILGLFETATSSLVGMLNCHPEIFILYEVYLKQAIISRYGLNFLERYPEARKLFRTAVPLTDLYEKMGVFFKENGFSYKYVGDKLPGFDTGLFEEIKQSKIVYCVRDLRSWLLKDQVVESCLAGNDFVPLAIDYCVNFLESFKLPDVFHCRMEEFINDNDSIINKLEPFLEIDLRPHLDNWWEKIVIEDSNNPKSLCKWWTKHPSSLIKPQKVDIEFVLNLHSFWDIILDIFNKYYDNPEKNFADQEISQDIEKLKSLIRYSPLSLQDSYRQIKYHLADGREKVLDFTGNAA